MGSPPLSHFPPSPTPSIASTLSLSSASSPIDLASSGSDSDANPTRLRFGPQKTPEKRWLQRVRRRDSREFHRRKTLCWEADGGEEKDRIERKEGDGEDEEGTPEVEGDQDIVQLGDEEPNSPTLPVAFLPLPPYVSPSTFQARLASSSPSSDPSSSGSDADDQEERDEAMDYEGDSYGAYTPTLAGDGVEGAVDDSFDEVGGEEEEGEDWIDEDEEVEAEEGGEDVMQGSGMQAQARERVLEEQEGEAPGSETEEELTSGDDEAATKEDDLDAKATSPPLPRLALDDLTLDASSTVDTSNILLTSSYPAQLWPETALASRLAEEELAREESESKPAEEEVLEKTIGRVVAQLDEESGDGSGVKNSLDLGITELIPEPAADLVEEESVAKPEGPTVEEVSIEEGEQFDLADGLEAQEDEVEESERIVTALEALQRPIEVALEALQLASPSPPTPSLTTSLHLPSTPSDSTLDPSPMAALLTTPIPPLTNNTSYLCPFSPISSPHRLSNLTPPTTHETPSASANATTSFAASTPPPRSAFPSFLLEDEHPSKQRPLNKFLKKTASTTSACDTPRAKVSEKSSSSADFGMSEREREKLVRDRLGAAVLGTPRREKKAAPSSVRKTSSLSTTSVAATLRDEPSSQSISASSIKDVVPPTPSTSSLVASTSLRPVPSSVRRSTSAASSDPIPQPTPRSEQISAPAPMLTLTSRVPPSSISRQTTLVLPASAPRARAPPIPFTSSTRPAFTHRAAPPQPKAALAPSRFNSSTSSSSSTSASSSVQATSLLPKPSSSSALPKPSVIPSKPSSKLSSSLSGLSRPPANPLAQSSKQAAATGVGGRSLTTGPPSTVAGKMRVPMKAFGSWPAGSTSAGASSIIRQGPASLSVGDGSMTMTVISSGGGSVAFAVGAGGSFMDSPRRMGKPIRMASPTKRQAMPSPAPPRHRPTGLSSSSSLYSGPVRLGAASPAKPSFSSSSSSYAPNFSSSLGHAPLTSSRPLFSSGLRPQAAFPNYSNLSATGSGSTPSHSTSIPTSSPAIVEGLVDAEGEGSRDSSSPAPTMLLRDGKEASASASSSHNKDSTPPLTNGSVSHPPSSAPSPPSSDLTPPPETAREPKQKKSSKTPSSFLPPMRNNSDPPPPPTPSTDSSTSTSHSTTASILSAPPPARSLRTRHPAPDPSTLSSSLSSGPSRGSVPPASKRSKPNPPPATNGSNGSADLSPAQLKSLTVSNTTKNQVYFSAIEKVVVRREGLTRPVSPGPKVRKVGEAKEGEKKLAAQGGRRRGRALFDEPGASGDEADEAEEEEREVERLRWEREEREGHVLGPGEEEEYFSPVKQSNSSNGGSARKKGKGREEAAGQGERDKRGKGFEGKAVKWDKGLVWIRPRKKDEEAAAAREAEADEAMEQNRVKGCISKPIHLDALGNLIPSSPSRPLVPITELIKRDKIKYTRFVYDDDMPKAGEGKKKGKK